MVVRPSQFSAVLTVERGSLSVSFRFPERMCYKTQSFLSHLAHAPFPSGKRCQVVVVPRCGRRLVVTFRRQSVKKLAIHGGEVKAVQHLAQGLPVHHVVVLDVLRQALLQGRALAEQAVDEDRSLGTYQ